MTRMSRKTEHTRMIRVGERKASGPTHYLGGRKSRFKGI